MIKKMISWSGFFKTITLFFVIVFASSCHMAQKNKIQSENYHQMAVSVLSQCNTRLALSHLLKAKKIRTQDFKVRHTLGIVYFSLGEYEKAAKELKSLIRSNPNVTEARLNLALTYIHLKKYKEALKEINKAEKDSAYSNPLKIIEIKAMIDFEQGRLASAKKGFQEVNNISRSKNCFRLSYLGQIDMKLGQTQSAENTLKQAIRVCAKENQRQKCQDQKNYTPHYFLAKLYMKTNKQKAKYHLKIFLRNATTHHNYIREAKELLKKL